MKLDRNENADGSGKYAILNLRVMRDLRDDGGQLPPEIASALFALANAGVLDWGSRGSEGEFFLIKLKDRHAREALTAYARSVYPVDREFADEVLEMAARSGPVHPYCKEPD